MYFSLAITTTFGFGDITPKNAVERIFVTVFMYIAAAVNSTMLTLVMAMISELSVDKVDTSIYLGVKLTWQTRS